MAEWFKAAVLKTVEVERLPGVRIPLSPPYLAGKFFPDGHLAHTGSAVTHMASHIFRRQLARYRSTPPQLVPCSTAVVRSSFLLCESAIAS